MAAKKGRWLVIGTAPNARNWFEAAKPFLNRDDCHLSAFSPDRIAAIRDLVVDYPLVEVGEFGTVTARAFLKQGAQARPLPNRDFVEQAIGLAMVGEDYHLREERLPLLYRWARFPGAHEALASAFEQLRSWDISHERLAEMAGQCDLDLQVKLRDLSKISELADATLLKLGRSFNRWRMKELLEREDDPPELTGTLIILAGNEVKPLEREWLGWLQERGTDIVLIVDAAPAELGAFQGAGFWGEFAAPALPGVAGAVYGVNQETSVQVQVWRAPDPLGECEWVLRQIAERIDQGELPSDIAIFARATDDYLPRLRMVAARHGVKLRMSYPQKLSGRPFAQFVAALLGALAAPTVRGLLAVSRRSYVGSDAESSSTLAAALRGCLGEEDSWAALEGWVEEQEVPPAWLSEALRWRRDAQGEARTLEGWHGKLSELLAQEWMLLALAQGASDDQNVQNGLIRGVSTAASLDRVTRPSLIPFGRLPQKLAEIWDRERILETGTMNGVPVVGSAAAIGSARHVYALGLVEGRFPRSRREHPVLSDSDLAQISALQPDKPALLDSHDMAARERDEFLRLLCAPSASLVLTYPTSEGDRQSMPAFYLEEIKKALGIQEIKFPRRRWVPETPFTEADRVLAEALTAGPEPLTEFELSDLTLKLEVGDSTSQRFTVQRYVDASECPFRHLARHRLGVRPQGERYLYAGLTRLPEKARLARVPDEATARINLATALAELLDELAGQASPDQILLVEAAGNRMIEDWVRREFAARKLWPREDFVSDPVGFEYPPFQESLRLGGDLPAVSNRNGVPVAHVFRSRHPWDKDVPIKEDMKFWVGLHLMALDWRGALEIDTAKGRVVIAPDEVYRPHQKSDATLYATRLTSNDVTELREATKQSMREAARVIRNGRVTATPGEGKCEHCDYGELCRRSRLFSETPDLFGGPQ